MGPERAGAGAGQDGGARTSTKRGVCREGKAVVAILQEGALMRTEE